MKTQQTEEPSLTTRLTGTYPKSAKRKAAPAQAQHSPLPWKSVEDQVGIIIEPQANRGASYVAIIDNRGCRDQGTREANAAFIVRACNNAQRLADALKLHLSNGGPLSDPLSRKQANDKAREALAQWEGITPARSPSAE